MWRERVRKHERKMCDVQSEEAKHGMKVLTTTRFVRQCRSVKPVCATEEREGERGVRKEGCERGVKWREKGVRKE